MNNKLSLQQKKKKTNKIKTQLCITIVQNTKVFLSVLSSIPDQVSKQGIGGTLRPSAPPSIVPLPGNMLMSTVGQE